MDRIEVSAANSRPPMRVAGSLPVKCHRQIVDRLTLQPVKVAINRIASEVVRRRSGAASEGKSFCGTSAIIAGSFFATLCRQCLLVLVLLCVSVNWQCSDEGHPRREIVGIFFGSIRRFARTFVVDCAVMCDHSCSSDLPWHCMSLYIYLRQ
jgi:hypothetical protein